MILNELFTHTDDINPYRNDKEDNSVAKKSDTRKTRLTLAHINKLRYLNDARTVEQEEKIKQIQQQYKKQSDNEPAGGLGI